MLGNSAAHGAPAVCRGSCQLVTKNDGGKGGKQKRSTSIKHGYYPTYMPRTAKSSSSNRIRASSVVSTVKLNKKRGSTRRRSNKRAKKKYKKQCQFLVDVPMMDALSLSQEVIDSNIVFGDGGQRSNPPISPVINAENNIKKKPIIILSIADGKLSTPHGHMNDPSRGLISRSNRDEVNFLLIPRKDAIASFVEKPSLSINICGAIDAVESVTRSTQLRGQAKHVMVEDPRNKYICTGNQTNRAGPGIRSMHYSLKLVNKEHSSHLMKVFSIIENLFDAWMDTGVIRLIRAALDLVNANTFTVQLPSQPGEDQPRYKSSRIYGAFASGINAYLNAHTDCDFIFGAVTIHMEEEYTLGQRVVAYFLFPRLGIAVPLRPGDVLFFNPQEPHCISSRVDNNDKIYCVSLYLKSDNLGLNDNSKPLTKDQEYYLGKYEMSHRI
jgi:hypothetical protein